MCASTTAACLVVSTKRQSHPLLSLLCITQTQKIPPPFVLPFSQITFQAVSGSKLHLLVSETSPWHLAEGFFLVQNVNSFEWYWISPKVS